MPGGVPVRTSKRQQVVEGLVETAPTHSLQNIAYGLYRVKDVPSSGLDQYAEAVARVGPDAYLTHDAVLAMHDLALVNPRVLRVGTPHRSRASWSPHLEVLHRSLPSRDVTEYEGIRSTTVARALIDCRDLVMRERLEAAVSGASARGLLTRAERPDVEAALGLRVRA